MTLRTLLIIEDNPRDREYLEQTLAQDHYRILSAPNGLLGLQMFEREKPDAVILDILLPDIDGFEVCRRIRKNKMYMGVPILFYTAVTTIDEKLLGLELGAADFLVKTADERELLVRVRNLLRSKKTMEELVEMSFVDSLTEVYNRRYFMHRLRDEFERGNRYQRHFCCTIIDVDHFKEVNDSYGHLMGDTALRAVAGVLRRSVRAADVICRYGGDEFGWLLPETDLQGAYQAAERVRQAVAQADVARQDRILRLTVSCGVSSFSNATGRMEDVLAQADTELYKAKEQGRNRTSVFLNENERHVTSPGTDGVPPIPPRQAGKNRRRKDPELPAPEASS